MKLKTETETENLQKFVSMSGILPCLLRTAFILTDCGEIVCLEVVFTFVSVKRYEQPSPIVVGKQHIKSIK